MLALSQRTTDAAAAPRARIRRGEKSSRARLPLLAAAAGARRKRRRWRRSRHRRRTRRSAASPHRGATAAARQKALQRGRIVHRLMQSLPDIPPARRMEAPTHYLAGAAKDFSVGGAGRNRAASVRPCSTMPLRRAFRARQPRRSADRRPHRATRAERWIAFRPDRPPGRHRRCRPDRRLQDRPACAARTRRGAAGYVTQLALYRAVLGSSTRIRRARRTDLDRSACVMEIPTRRWIAELRKILTNRR